MASQESLAHLFVRDRAEDRDFRRAGGGGDAKIREVERRAHGRARRRELDESVREAERRAAASEPTIEELRAIGVVVMIEGADANYPLRIESLQSYSRHTRAQKRPRWLLLSVTPPSDGVPERATVWISDEYRAGFLRLFEQYLSRQTRAGHPRNRQLVANIGRIRAAVLRDLWQSAGEPQRDGVRWWELWLEGGDNHALELIRAYASEHELEIAPRHLKLDQRTVVWLRCAWASLEQLPFTSVPVTEIRRPELVETVEDLPREEQEELTDDLASRIEHCDNPRAPAVCHLDSGVRRTHALLQRSLADRDVHTLFDNSADRKNHGTAMASLALLGPLDGLLLGSGVVRLRHRLESVKILPDPPDGHDPRVYGLVTAQAVALPEATANRARAFCMPVSTEPDRPGGEPTLWSASIDALAAGIDISADGDGIALLGAPEAAAARLFVVAAGNVPHRELRSAYLDVCDLAVVEDPAQAWNALTVGAYTELTGTPGDPTYVGWAALGHAGDLSPHSRTGVQFAQPWPNKPDICMEGGNVLTNGAADFVGDHPVLALRTADARDDLALGSSNATSAACAQTARLAAIAQATYPEFWPETIRGLLVHAAEWTPAMRAKLNGATSRTALRSLLRRYGWGAPVEDAVLSSSRQAVTMVAQDEFVPFEGEEHRARHFRLHRLPWPQAVLSELAEQDVTLKITLSYFIEPAAARRGWRRRYSYASHGLRFELKGATEGLDDFVSRINRQAHAEEEGETRRNAETGRWFVGPNQRNHGSLHQDIWEGSGAELAQAGVVAINPIGGWWKYSNRKDRVDRPVRYALLLSLRTRVQGIDLYTPIATQLELPIEVVVPGS